MVGRNQRPDGSVTMVSVLAPLLMLKCATALGALDPTLDPSRLEDDTEAAAIDIQPSDVSVHRGALPGHRDPRSAMGAEQAGRDARQGARAWSCAARSRAETRKAARARPGTRSGPMGFVCSNHFTKAKKPPDVGAALPLSPGKRLPHAYALVRADGTPAYGSEERRTPRGREALPDQGHVARRHRFDRDRRGSLRHHQERPDRRQVGRGLDGPRLPVARGPHRGCRRAGPAVRLGPQEDSQRSGMRPRPRTTRSANSCCASASPS